MLYDQKTQMDMVYWFITIENFPMDQNNMKSTCRPNHRTPNKAPSTQPLYKAPSTQGKFRT